MPFIDQPREIDVQEPVVAIHASEHVSRLGTSEHPERNMHPDIADLQNSVHGQIVDAETEREAAHAFRRILLKTNLLENPSPTNSWEIYSARYNELKSTSGGRELYHLLQKGWQPIIMTNSAESAEMVTIGFRIPDIHYRLVMQNFDMSVTLNTRDARHEMSDEEYEIEKKKISLNRFHLKVQAELEQCFPSSLNLAFEDAKRSPVDFSSFNMALDRYGEMLRDSLSPGALNRLLYYERILFGEDLFRLEPPAVLPDEVLALSPMDDLHLATTEEPLAPQDPPESQESQTLETIPEAPITLPPIDM